jgi:GTP-binding protein HflX
LAETAGVAVAEEKLLELRRMDPATFIGSGKVEMLTQAVKEKGIDVVIFDHDLSPTQYRNLEEAFQCKVMDRTGLILDIFAGRARSGEGKVQVELAQLHYLLPRLSGKGSSMSQLGGGIGTRGPGETRLELDRRKAKVRYAQLKEKLKKIKGSRALHRERREKVPIPVAALVGYTNAGKSTLLNALTQARVLAEDKLFATLDPTARRLKLPSGRECLVVDTVGFIEKLPHALVEAFRATFEESLYADLLVHVVDASHPHSERQVGVVRDVLKQFQLDVKPVLTVLNKMDRVVEPSAFAKEEGALPISAVEGRGFPQLLQAIDEGLTRGFKRVHLLIPYEDGQALSEIYQTSRILKRENRGEGVYLEVDVNEKNDHKYRRYRT